MLDGGSGYLRRLTAYLRIWGWPCRFPLAILARAFQVDGYAPPEGSRRILPLIVFKDEAAFADLSLGAHEAGHVAGLPHAGWLSWTTMHPWGICRRSDPERLVPEWERARQAITWEGDKAK